jgi:DnaJ family protein C protein 27
MAQNFYNILGVSRDASVDDIKKAYKKAALAHHPDKGGDPEKFKEVSAAAENLTDERKRREYDSALLRAHSRDGLRFSYDDRDSTERRGSSVPSAPARPPAYERASSANKVPTAGGPKPPRPPQGAVEIPADPSGLSVKELRDLLTSLNISHEGCIEKIDLLTLLKNRKSGRDGNDGTPRAAAGGGGFEKPSTPRQRPPSGDTENQPGQANRAAPHGSPSSSKGPRAIRVKIISLGSESVGKSCLIKRFCEGRFVQKYITTIGVDYGVKPVQVLGNNVKVNFFDTSGGNEYKEIRVEFYGGTQAAVIVYDVTNRRSFAELDSWLEEANRYGCPLSKQHKTGDAPFVILCANKIDLPKRVVSREDGMEFAHLHGMYYYETSAATGDSVSEALTFLFEKVVGHHMDVRRKLKMSGC